MAFDTNFKYYLEEMIDKTHDDYESLEYSDEIHVQVWSLDGEGSFEIYAIVPHDAVDMDAVDITDSSQLPLDLPTAEEFYDDIDRLVEEVTGNEYPNLTFYLLEVVDDGTWERDATAFCTHELKA